MLIKYLNILFISLIISSCGFKPLYDKRRNFLDLESKFSKIKVESLNKNYLSEELKFELERSFTHSNKENQKEFILKVDASKYINNAAIQKNNDATIYSVQTKIEYELYNIHPYQLIKRGYLSMNSSFNGFSEYNNYIASDFSYKNNIREICEDLKNIIGIILVDNYISNENK